MSATNHTSNYNLPIYEAGNTANWLVDFNGAMNTIDGALNENKLAGDTLKTDMEELQTDFQQVSTKADAAEQAATQASTNAANALTIANNATTIAGDAQVDAHAALTQIEKLTKPLSTLVFYDGKGQNGVNILITPISILMYGYMYFKHNDPETTYHTPNSQWYAPSEWTPLSSPELSALVNSWFPKGTAWGMSDTLSIRDNRANNIYTYIDCRATPIALYRTNDDKFIPVWTHLSVETVGDRIVLGLDNTNFFNPLISKNPLLRSAGKMTTKNTIFD